MKIEFLPWYVPGGSLSMCGGDNGCGAAVVDTETHMKWHEQMQPPAIWQIPDGWTEERTMDGRVVILHPGVCGE
jgi:hypothetical protein